MALLDRQLHVAWMRGVKGLDNLLGLGGKVVMDTLQDLHVGLDAIQLDRDDVYAVRQLALLRAERCTGGAPRLDVLDIHRGVFAAPLAVEVEGGGEMRGEERRGGVDLSFIVISVVCSVLQDVEDGHGRHDEDGDEEWWKCLRL